MKHRKKLMILLTLTACMVLFCSFPVFAAELTEAQVEQAVAEQGKETVTGNVFVWFLCAIAFLKVSQKIDSFMASLGINVGNTGGNMMAELSAVNAATGYTEVPSIGNALYQSSLEKGGDFANNVISNIAQGNYGQVGSITGEGAEAAFQSYMGISADNKADHSYTNVEIGGGRITGVETTLDGTSREFAMYHADQYTAPTQGNFDTVHSVDGSAWYRQYAEDTVSKTPYDAGDGKVAYNESIVQKLPPTPSRKDRI